MSSSCRRGTTATRGPAIAAASIKRAKQSPSSRGTLVVAATAAAAENTATVRAVRGSPGAHGFPAVATAAMNLLRLHRRLKLAVHVRVGFRRHKAFVTAGEQQRTFVVVVTEEIPERALIRYSTTE